MLSVESEDKLLDDGQVNFIFIAGGMNFDPVEYSKEIFSRTEVYSDGNIFFLYELILVSSTLFS